MWLKHSEPKIRRCNQFGFDFNQILAGVIKINCLPNSVLTDWIFLLSKPLYSRIVIDFIWQNSSFSPYPKAFDLIVLNHSDTEFISIVCGTMWVIVCGTMCVSCVQMSHSEISAKIFRSIVKCHSVYISICFRDKFLFATYRYIRTISIKKRHNTLFWSSFLSTINCTANHSSSFFIHSPFDLSPL